MTSLDEFLDESKFATAINCIDGRTILPVINYITEKYQVDFVDLITEPGADLVMATRNPDKVREIRRILSEFAFDPPAFAFARFISTRVFSL